MISFECFSLLLLLEHFPSQPGSNQRREKWVDHQEEIYHLCPRKREICVLKGFCTSVCFSNICCTSSNRLQNKLQLNSYRMLRSLIFTAFLGGKHWKHTKMQQYNICHILSIIQLLQWKTPFTNQFAQLYAMVATVKAQGIVSSTCTSWRTCEKQLRPVLPTPHGNSTAIGRVRIYPFPSYRCFTREVPTALSSVCVRFCFPYFHYHSP